MSRDAWSRADRFAFHSLHSQKSKLAKGALVPCLPKEMVTALRTILREPELVPGGKKEEKGHEVSGGAVVR